MLDLVAEELELMDEIYEDSPLSINEAFCDSSIAELDLPKAIVLDEESSLAHAVETLKNNHIGAIIVVKDKKITGIFTERDFINRLNTERSNIHVLKLKEVMTSDPFTLRDDDAISYALQNMHWGQYRHIPIVDKEGHPLYMLSVRDLLHYIVSFLPERIQLNTANPYRGVKHRESA